MTDHDRGAYTPQTDAPLAFDARQPSGGRRGFPTTLVVSVVILIALVGAIFAFYRSGVRGANQAPTPVGTPVAGIKTPAPAAPAPSQGLEIYKSEAGSATAASSAPVFAAPPEQPQPRPAPVIAQPAPPPVASPAQVAASGATSKPAAPAPAAPAAAVVAVAPAPVNAVPMGRAPVPATSTAKAPKAAAPKSQAKGDEIADLLAKSPTAKTAAVKPAPAPVAKTETEAAPRPAAHGAAVVQIGAYSSAGLAGKGWSDIAAAFPGEMSGKGKLVEGVDKDGKTLYRAAVSGFASHADAAAFCAKLKAAGRPCIVK
jgi:hypothetical protein